MVRTPSTSKKLNALRDVLGEETGEVGEVAAAAHGYGCPEEGVDTVD